MGRWMQGQPMPDPLYTAENCRPAYQLNWSVSLFWRSPGRASATWIEALTQSCETDGVRILEHRRKSPTTTQFLVSTRPGTAPPEIVRSLKGRLQYLVRPGAPKAFQRNYAIHSVGSVNRAAVEAYVASQLGHHAMADKRVQERLSRYQIHGPEVDLSQPQRSAHGEYRYNLHLVLVQEGRWNEVDENVLSAVRDMLLKASRAKGHRLSRAGILADHVHVVVGCGLTESPLEVVLGYLNNLAYAQRMKRVYQFGFYVGTVGEYDLDAIRRQVGE